MKNSLPTDFDFKAVLAEKQDFIKSVEKKLDDWKKKVDQQLENAKRKLGTAKQDDEVAEKNKKILEVCTFCVFQNYCSSYSWIFCVFKLRPNELKKKKKEMQHLQKHVV